MKHVFALLFALLISYSSYSQRGKDYFLIDSVEYDSLSAIDRSILDSILLLYHASKHDTSRFAFLNVLVENLNEENLWVRYNLLVHHQTKAALNHEGISKLEEKTIKKYYASSLQTMGYYQEKNLDNLSKAMDYYNECKKIQEEIGDKKGLGTTLNNMASVFQYQGNIPKSLEYLLMSLTIAESMQDKRIMGYILNNIGSQYFFQGDTSLALDYQKRALELRQEIGDKIGIVFSLELIANIYRSKKDFQKSLYYFFECYRTAKENRIKETMASSYISIGWIYLSMWEETSKNKNSLNDSLLQKSAEYFNSSLLLWKEIDDKRGITMNLLGIGTLSYAQNDQEKALSYAKEALEIAQNLGFPFLIRDVSRLLYKIYKRQGNWTEALAMHELHILMRDSLLNEESKKSVFKQQTKYEYEKQKALNDAENQKELAIAEEGKKRQQIITYSIAVGLLMLIMFSLFIFNRLQITKKQKHIIEGQKKTVEQKNKHITDSINYAKRIQDAILPSKEELTRSFSEHFVFFQPREIVSGDFYWLSSVDDKIIVAVADCTGHGVPGAFMSMIGNTLLNEIVNEKKMYQPADILNELNEGIVQALHQETRFQDDGMDISVCLVEKDKNKATFAGANHSLYVVSDNSIEVIDGDIYSIGSMLGKKGFMFSQKEILLKKDTTLFLSTDGFGDQRGGENGKKFSTKSLAKLFIDIAGMNGTQQQAHVQNAFHTWKGNYPQIDDVLVMGIK